MNGNNNYRNTNYQNPNYQNYQNNNYQDSGYADAGYQDSGYQDAGYQDGGYQDAGYQDGGYQDAGYQDGGYQDDDFAKAGTNVSANANIVISARNIHKTFGKGETAQVVLDGANLDIAEGSFVSLMGESGSGKSTLLYLIGGLDRNFTGDIYVSGQNISNLSDSKLSEIRCKSMGFVFQFYNLAANLTVEDNILLPLEMSGRRVSDYREKYKEILEITGLENKVKSYPSQLSGGQQQRVAIARAVLGEPEIILADEPTGNLDAASGAEIMELFLRLNKERGVTILQVTHSAECASYSNRIVTLKNRVIVG